jgi:transposase
MGKKRGRTAYTEEFRREAVRLTEREPERVAQIARELDVHPETLRQWVRRAQPDGSIVPPTRTVTLEEENRQLRRENERLREEREILKKATAFFAKDTR